MLLEGRAAVVTGAGGGIGRATALLMAQEGARVVVNDYGASMDGRGTSSEPANHVVAEIKAAGGEAAANADTVATVDGARHIMDCCLDNFGRVDILVNCAGNLIRKFMIDTEESDWDCQFDVHLKGTFLCAKAAAQHMMRHKYGRIINCTSRAGLKGTPGLSAYGAAKAGVIGFTLVVARELASYNITVNMIAPRADTRMNLEKIPQPIIDMMIAYGFASASSKSSSYIGPEHVAPVVTYLASEEAACVNGQIIGIRGDYLQLWSQPDVIRSAIMPGGWSVESLRRHFPATVGQGLSGSLPKP